MADFSLSLICCIDNGYVGQYTKKKAKCLKTVLPLHTVDYQANPTMYTTVVCRKQCKKITKLFDDQM